MSEKISIVYEDKNLLVVNKPSGLITHPKNTEDKQESLTGWLVEKYPEIKTIGEDPLRPGLVHRLDKDTSGLLVIAKTQDSFLYLKSLFQDKKIKKFYLALVNGKPKEPKGVIDAPMGRIGMKRTTQVRGNKKLKDKKEAVTEYSTLKNFHDFTLLEVSPHTGRTHQIRVHLKSIGNTVAGDPLYGHKNPNGPKQPERLFLHAYKLQFVSPDGKSFSFETDLPEDLQKFINELE
jgi:23S rRNA pseudouridine1911/1915/1917 synthase